MAVKKRSMAYPIAELIEVESEGTTIIDVMKIQPYSVIEKVLVRVKTASTNAVNVEVGDDDDPNGFIEATAVNVADVVIGDQLGLISAPEVGDYLAKDDGAGTPTDRIPHGGKLYTASNKEIKLVLSGAAGAVEAVLEVLVLGHRFAV